MCLKASTYIIPIPKGRVRKKDIYGKFHTRGGQRGSFSISIFFIFFLFQMV